MNVLKVRDLILDLKGCWLWQYDKAHNLNAIMSNQETFFKKYSIDTVLSFLRDVFNINTANNFGLEVWRRILGASQIDASYFCLNIALEKVGDDYNFVFASEDGKWNYMWSSDKQFRVKEEEGEEELISVEVKDVIYKRYLISKIMLYYMKATLPNIQRYFDFLFPNAGIVVSSENNMTINIANTNEFNPEEKVLFELEDIFPVICGVEKITSKSNIRFAFWDKNVEEKPNYMSGETEEDINNNYPYTYVEDEVSSSNVEKGHGTFGI